MRCVVVACDSSSSAVAPRHRRGRLSAGAAKLCGTATGHRSRGPRGKRKSEVAHREVMQLASAAERRERVLAEDAGQTVGHEDIVRGEHPTAREVKGSRAVLPRHVVEGMQAVVVEHVDAPQPGEQPGPPCLPDVRAFAPSRYHRVTGCSAHRRKRQDWPEGG